MENAPFKLETCHMQFHGISLQIKDDYTTTRQGLAPSAIMQAICVVALFSGMAAPESGKKHLPHGGKVAPPS
jgi:hypothetical protein